MDRRDLSPNRLCEDCRRTPAGLAGHDGLRQFHDDTKATPAATGAALFECTDCEARWARTYCGEGYFAWTCESRGLSRAQGD